MLHAIIMAGGSGTRFWPESRADKPKQLLDLIGGQTMIQATVARLAGLVSPEQILVVTNERLVDPIAEQLPQVPKSSVIGEPCKRDTAPCVGLAAFLVSAEDEDATMVVMPADHVIPTDEAFRDAIRYAARLVDENPTRLVTFGIRPSYPAETFGYIERGEAVAPSTPKTFRVAQFHEKPRADVAAKYFESGDYYWNSGIFVWKAATILESLQQYEPEMYGHLKEIAAAAATPDFHDVFHRRFTAIEGTSIDYAVMEKAKDVVVIEAPFDWDDVGNWQSVARLRGTDESGNTIVGGKYLGLETSGTIVRTDEEHLVVTVGLSDCIVVHTPKATLVANKRDEESIRKVVKLLKEKGWEEYL